jgi:alanyl-tRNA synthetase
MVKENPNGYILHSAEHLFARSLQNFGLKINITKADTFRADGKAFLLIKEHVSLTDIFKAEAKVNEIIPTNLRTSVETFKNLDEAIAAHKDLRFNEPRLKDKEHIRVVKLGDFDVCACKNEHVKISSEIVAFAIVGVSYLHGNTEVEFKASRDAIDYFADINDKAVDLGQEYNFKPPELSKAYKSLDKRLADALDELDKTFTLLLKQSENKFIDFGNIGISIFYKTINNFARDNPERAIILLSKNQLFAVRGANNKSDLKRLGEMLKEKKVFIGEVREDYLNGKVLDYPGANLVINEFSSLIL